MGKIHEDSLLFNMDQSFLLNVLASLPNVIKRNSWKSCSWRFPMPMSGFSRIPPFQGILSVTKCSPKPRLTLLLDHTYTSNQYI